MKFVPIDELKLPEYWEMDTITVEQKEQDETLFIRIEKVKKLAAYQGEKSCKGLLITFYYKNKHYTTEIETSKKRVVERIKLILKEAPFKFNEVRVF